MDVQDIIALLFNFREYFVSENQDAMINLLERLRRIGRTAPISIFLELPERVPVTVRFMRI
jgi:hypothetical protein